MRSLIGFAALALTLIWQPGYAQTVAEPNTDSVVSDLYQQAEQASALKQSNAAKGYQLALETLASAELAQDAGAEARSLVAAGENLNILGRNDEALDYYQRALSRYRQTRQLTWQGRVMRMIGVSYLDTGRPEEALENYVNALDLFERAGESLEAAKTRSNIGNVYWTLENYSQAIEYQRAALNTFHAEGFTMGVAGVSMNLGSLLNRKGAEADAEENPELAIQYYQQADEFQRQALDAFSKLEIPRGIQKALNNLGSIANNLGDFQQAQDYFLRSMHLAEEIGDQLEVLQTKSNLLDLYLATDQLDQAEQMLNHSLVLVQDLGSLEISKTVFENAVRYYEATGDYQSALEFERRLSELASRVRQQESDARVAELELQLQTQRQSVEIENLKRERRISELAMARHVLWRNSAMTGMAIVLILLVVLFARYRQRVKTTQQLRYAASTDSLTGLLNRRGMMPRIVEELSRYHRHGSPFSLLICDIDDFKKINDQFGHDTGDEALAAIARRIQRRLRNSDLAARWGGEEFLMLLPETDLSGARELAEFIRSEASRSLLVQSSDVSLGLSCGVAQIAAGMSADELIRAADQALLQAKRKGKNRVVSALSAVT